MSQQPTRNPIKETIKNSNIFKMMQKHHFTEYSEFWDWSVSYKEQFWKETVENLTIKFSKKFTKILDVSEGTERAKWLFGAKMNIVDSCFQNDNDCRLNLSS